MSKLPHGWYLLCDGGASQVAGELVEYLDVWAHGTTKELQRHYNVDETLRQFSLAWQGQQSAVGHLMRSYQMPAAWTG